MLAHYMCCSTDDKGFDVDGYPFVATTGIKKTFCFLVSVYVSLECVIYRHGD